MKYSECNVGPHFCVRLKKNKHKKILKIMDVFSSAPHHDIFLHVFRVGVLLLSVRIFV
jgi:hypothetical protein